MQAFPENSDSADVMFCGRVFHSQTGKLSHR